MLITYYGHSQFLLESADGERLFTDPCDIGYPVCRERVDYVTVSHAHSDHNATGILTGSPRVIDKAGEYSFPGGLRVTAIASVHDDRGGALRGNNLIMKIEMDDVTLAHLGDQGDLLTDQQLAALGSIDVLMLPVGGFYTVDAAKAQAIVGQLQPAVTIPMHYKTSVNADWPIADETEFLRLMGAQGLSAAPVLRVTREDLSEQPPIFLLDARKNTEKTGF